MKVDYLIIGAGLYGATFARLMTNKGYKCLVIDKNDFIGGNCYDYKDEETGILVHKYGPHIFHTDNEDVWKFVNKYSKFNSFVLNIIAKNKDKLYHLPFNMNTFYELFGTQTPREAKEAIEKETLKLDREPKNLEEQARSMVGDTIFNTLIKEYTEKQWHDSCENLSSNIIKRLPLRFSFNNNYFNDMYQGIPIGGYTKMITNILEGNTISGEKEEKIEVLLNKDFTKDDLKSYEVIKNIIYTGPIDKFFDYELGTLGWRSLYFINNTVDGDFQGNVLFNYTSHEKEYTRIIEHKYFYPEDLYKYDKSVITYEYPSDWKVGEDMYYPIENDNNLTLLQKYLDVAKNRYPNIIFAGRLGSYKYFDMDDSILKAINDSFALLLDKTIS